MSTRTFVTEERRPIDGDMKAGLHLDAFNGNIGKIERAISRNENIVNQYFAYSEASLLTDEEQRNEHYIPPPALPKLIRLTLKKPVQTMTLDQRWLLSNAFADSTLLHYACAGDQLEVVKLLLQSGADWTLVNASNKTADTYTQSDAIRELFEDADGRYNPLPTPSQNKPKAPPMSSAPPIPLEPPTGPPPPVPTSILKPGTGRRRQSLVNDAAWTDSNLRSTVHHSEAPLVRSASIVSPQQQHQQQQGGRGIPPRAPSFRRPDEDEPEEDECEPIATFVPMSFRAGAHSDSFRSQVSNNNNTASTYSAAESVDSRMSGLELERDPGHSHPPADDYDSASVSTALTGTSSNLAPGAGAGGSKMNARRRSRVVNSLRLRGSLSQGVAGAGELVARTRVPPPPPPLPAAAPQPPAKTAAQKVGAAAKRKEEDTANDNSAVKRDNGSGIKENRKAVRKTKSKEKVKPVAGDGASDSEQEGAARVASKAKEKKSKKNKKTKPDNGGGRSASEEAKQGSENSNKLDKGARRQDPAPSKTEESEGPAKAKEPPVHRLPTAPPPPLRVMRRLSVNMSSNALQAVSYVEGAGGEQQVLESTDLPVSESSSQPKDPARDAGSLPDPPLSGMGRLFPGASDASVASNHSVPATAQPAVDSSAQKKAAALEMVAESGEDVYLEAWECKATDVSPFARLQSSLLSGLNAEKSVQEADALIAKVAKLEKQEAREARLASLRAERLEQMLQKLTPLEHIASGVLRGRQGLAAVVDGAAATGVSRLLAEDHAAESGEEAEAEGAEVLERAGGGAKAGADELLDGTLPYSAADLHLQSPDQSPARAHDRHLPNPAGSRPLTFREMIWRRAGQHLNSALSDKQRNEYDRARAEAYRMGVRLLRQEFRGMAQRERWEAVELVEEQLQRRHEAEMEAELHIRAATLRLGGTALDDGSVVSSVPVGWRLLDYSYGGQDDKAEEEYVERTTGRHQSYRPFS